MNKKERKRIDFLITKILARDLKDLDIKKLAGFSDLYRTREGKIRMIFRKEIDKNVIINIDYRQKIYQDL